MALRSQSFNERRPGPAAMAPARAHTHSDGELSDEVEEPANLAVNGKGEALD